MKMQEAMKAYYDRLKKHTLETKESLPRTGWDKDWNQEIYISGPDTPNEKAVWEPVFTAQPEAWGSLVEELGFTPTDLIKDYFFSCKFPLLQGAISGYNVWMFSVGQRRSQEKSAVIAFKAAQVPGRDHAFLLGGAEINGNDGYSLYYDDNTAALFLDGCDQNGPVFLAMTPQELISRLDPA